MCKHNFFKKLNDYFKRNPFQFGDIGDIECHTICVLSDYDSSI